MGDKGNTVAIVIVVLILAALLLFWPRSVGSGLQPEGLVVVPSEAFAAGSVLNSRLVHENVSFSVPVSVAIVDRLVLKPNIYAGYGVSFFHYSNQLFYVSFVRWWVSSNETRLEVSASNGLNQQTQRIQCRETVYLSCFNGSLSISSDLHPNIQVLSVANQTLTGFKVGGSPVFSSGTMDFHYGVEVADQSRGLLERLIEWFRGLF